MSVTVKGMGLPECETQQEEESVSAKDVTIVIPCFNEAGPIGQVLDELHAAFPEAELIGVDDGSRDRSDEAVLQREHVRLLRHQQNKGYGASIKTACAKVRRDYVVWYDADGQHRPEMVRALLRELKHSDCVLGMRTSQSHVDWLRKPGKLALSFVARLLTGQHIPDLNCGLRAFRTSLLRRYLHLLPDGFSASTTSTILMLERGYNVRWVRVATTARVGKSSVRQLRDGSRIVMLILHLVNLFKPLRFYLPISACLFFGGSIYGLSRAFLSGRGSLCANMSETTAS